MSREISLKELINPFPRQEEFLKATDTHKYPFYGGAKGGGKSRTLRWAVTRKLLQYAQRGFIGVRGAIFCEDYPTLRDRQITKIQTEFPRWLGDLSGSQIEGMSFKLKPKFGSGVIALRNLDDVSKYASSEFAVAAVDELTKNQRSVFDQLRSIIRWPGIEDTCLMGGSNPGEIGHAWVKKLWIDKEFTPEDPDPSQIIFVKSLPIDNPYNAQSYIEELKRLPEKLRKAYFEGNWDVFEGQFFTEWNRDVHVIDPFVIPGSWKKFRSIDVSGRTGITSCHWFALDWDGNVFVYREYYETNKDSDEHAQGITQLSEGEDYVYTVIDSAAFDKLGLPETIAEVYQNGGVNNLVPSSKNRIQGWDFMHQYLRHNEFEGPKIKFFSNCKNAIRTIPLLIHDKLQPADVDSEGEDHAADEIRYFLQTLRRAKTPEESSKSDTSLNIVQRRLQELKAQNNTLDFSYIRNDL